VIYLKPQTRVIRRGNEGRDVMATKYALKQAGFGRALNLTSARAGSAWQANLKRFQAKHKLKADGQYGASTHKALRPYIAKVPYAVWLWNHTAATSKLSGMAALGSTDKRKLIVNAALYGAQHEPSIHYTQSSLRMYGVRNKVKPPGIPRYEDCSSFATWCYWLAGASDPNGLGYNGQGYTGTLAAHGSRRTLAYARPGDLVFYGGGFPYTHVAIYIGGGRVVSHGSEHGPIICAAWYRPISTIRSYLP
jgi:cell wall-associated NlpC family hydrolase